MKSSLYVPRQAPHNKTMKFCTWIFLLFFSFSAWAAEEAPASGGGDGADREWAKRTNKLNVQEQKIKDLKKKIQDLINANKQGHTLRDEKGQPLDTLKAMADFHRQLKETIGEYNKEKAELKYRYPEEGTLINRRYVLGREQTLEEIAREIGLDGELIRLKTKIDKKYEPIVGEKPKAVPQRPKQPQATLKDTKAQEPERLKLVK